MTLYVYTIHKMSLPCRRIHNVIHMSQLQSCSSHDRHVLFANVVNSRDRMQRRCNLLLDCPEFSIFSTLGSFICSSRYSNHADNCTGSISSSPAAWTGCLYTVRQQKTPCKNDGKLKDFCECIGLRDTEILRSRGWTQMTKRVCVKKRKKKYEWQLV